MKRAVMHVKYLLEQEGHEFGWWCFIAFFPIIAYFCVVAWQPPDIEHALGLFSRIFLPDAGEQVLLWARLGRPDVYLHDTYFNLKIPHWLAHTIAFFVQPFWRRVGRL
jgi:hypothetical protein